MYKKYKKNVCKAAITITILAMVLPGSAAFANFGTTNETTIDKNVSMLSNNGDATSINNLLSINNMDNVISDARSSNNIVNVPSVPDTIPSFDVAESPDDRETYDETSESGSVVDWWPMFQHDLNNTGYSSGSAPNTNNVQWKSDFKAGGSPAVVDGKIFLRCSVDEKIYCLNASNGSVIWKSSSTSDGGTSTPVIVDGKVFTSSSTGFSCLNATNGAMIWRASAITSTESSPAVTNGRLFVGNRNDLYCLDASGGSVIWMYPTDSWISSSPAVVDGRVFFGSWDNNVYCLNAINASLIWKYQMDHRTYSSPTVSDGKVYIGSCDNNIHCIDAQNGSLIWKHATDDDVMSSPAVAYGKVYAGSNDGYLYCLNAQTGIQIWAYDTKQNYLRSPPVVADGKVFVNPYCNSPSYNSLFCLNAQTGLFIWEYFTEVRSESSPAIADGKLFISLDKVGLCCFGPNRPPNEPNNPNPEDDAVDVDINMDISWTGGDPDTEDIVIYDVYFGTTDLPSKVISTQQNFYDSGALDYETEYFWKIIAWDDSNTSTESLIWSFTTEVETSQPPYQPNSPVPWDGDIGVNIDIGLRWVGGDPNPSDIVTYDVYFGTTSPPSKIIDNQSATVHDLEIMDNDTVYYWKIVAWDNHGASTESIIWSFTTEKKPGVDWWKMFQRDSNNTAYSLGLAPNSGNLLWNTADYFYMAGFHQPVVFDDKVYISTSYNFKNLYCFDILDGSVIWKSNLVGENVPAVANGRVFFSTDMAFYCLDASGGSVIWSYALDPGGESCPPVVADGKVFFGSSKHIHCLDAMDGSFIWKYNTKRETQSPVVSDGKIYIANIYGLHCLDASDGSVIWKYGKGVYSPPVVAYGKIFVRINGGFIHCINATDGSFIWTYRSDGFWRKHLAIAYGKIFCQSIRHMKIHLDAIDAETGSFIWEVEAGVEIGPVVADGKVFYACNQNIYCRDGSDGSLIWKNRNVDGIDGNINDIVIADEKIFATTFRGSALFCFGPFQGHDVGATNIDIPIGGLADVFTPEIRVKNFGIHDETDVPVNMMITKLFEPYLDEEFFGIFPPYGWKTEESGEWKRHDLDLAGGEPPEARLYYNDIQGDYAYIQSPSVDTTDSVKMILEFKSIISCYKGGSNCNVLIRSDTSEGWTDITPWSNPVIQSVPSKNYIIDASLFIGTGTQIRFEFDGDNEGIMYWSLDDIILYKSVSPEYNETLHIDIDAGVTKVLTFSDWTPEYLQYDTSGFIEYDVTIYTQMADEVPGNDRTEEIIMLEYIHDVGIEEITEPSGPPGPPVDEAWIHFDNGLNTGIGSVGGTYEGAIRITPDELGPYDSWVLTSVRFFHFIWTGSITHSGNIKIYEAGTDIYPGDLISITPYTVTGEGWHEILLLNPVVIDSDEDVWVSVEVTHAQDEYPIGVDVGPAVDGKGDWFGFQESWHELQFDGIDFNWNIWAKVEEVIGWPKGTYPVEAVVKNYGTFNEAGFNVNAVIYKQTMAGDELFWEDDVMVPLPLSPSDEIIVVFKDVTFGDKDIGKFRLEIATELVDDDNIHNDRNEIGFIMGILDTVPPVMTLDKQRIGLKTKFTASVIDPEPSSGIDRVEFYLDGEIQETFVEDTFVTEGVYEWNYTGLENLTVTVIVYDNAGNSNTKEMSTPYIRSQSSSPSPREINKKANLVKGLFSSLFLFKEMV